MPEGLNKNKPIPTITDLEIEEHELAAIKGKSSPIKNWENPEPELDAKLKLARLMIKEQLINSDSETPDAIKRLSETLTAKREERPEDPLEAAKKISPTNTSDPFAALKKNTEQKKKEDEKNPFGL